MIVSASPRRAFIRKSRHWAIWRSGGRPLSVSRLLSSMCGLAEWRIQYSRVSDAAVVIECGRTLMSGTQ